MCYICYNLAFFYNPPLLHELRPVRTLPIRRRIIDFIDFIDPAKELVREPVRDL